MKHNLLKRKGLFSLTILLTLLSDLIIAGETIVRQKLIDSVLELDANRIKSYIILVIGYALFSGLVYVTSSVCQDLFSAKLTDDMRRSVFAGVIRKSRKDFISVNYSDYISALTNDLSTIKRQYLGMIFMVILFAGGLVFSAALMFYYQPFVTIVAIICAAVMTVVPMVLGKRLEKWEKARSVKAAALTTCLTELFSGFHVISSFGIRKHAEVKFQKYSAELKNAEYGAEGLSSASDGFAQLLSGVAQAVILALACYMVFQEHMTMGALVAFISLNQTFCSSLTMVFRGIPMLKGIQPIINRVNELADYTANGTGKKVPTFYKQIEVQNLGFHYREGESVLDNVSLTLTPGEKCALTGESGSGKTTLIRLLTGELDGYSGKILYDGVDLSDIDCEAVCQISSVIHQDVFLFDDTIRNNICLFESFSEEEFDRAVRLSGVKKFMEQFTEGAEYQVGQRGEYLSGGQRQRIAIARALIRRTPLLILDEGTSALDAQTAREIEMELMSISELTLLTITHNLRDSGMYDQVIELQFAKRERKNC